MEKEFWKDIYGYEGVYRVSNLGNIGAIRYGLFRPIRISKQTVGYLKCGLSKNGKSKTYLVHRLVGEAFLEKIKGKNEINHKKRKCKLYCKYFGVKKICNIGKNI